MKRESKIFMNYSSYGIDEAFQMLEVKKGENKFLFSQDGLFTFPRYAELYYIKNGFWPNLEDFLVKIGSIEEEDFIIKMNLPKTETSELLRLLNAEGINSARLMPVLDNVVKTLNIKWENKSY